MAKKDTKKPEKTKDKKGKNKKGAVNANGIPPAGTLSTGAPSGANGVPSAGTPSLPLSAIPPDQMNQQQIEQALRDSSDPESRLKKLHSPISVKSCLLNLLILIVMTLAIVIIWCLVAVDKFNFVTVVKDMSSQFGITQGFQWLWTQISGWFS